VDDEPLLGTALKRFYEDRYDVVPVADPREALRRVQSGEHFVFVILDLQMPEMSGGEFLARLRDCAPDLARRCVIVTGASMEETAASFPESDRPLLLPKPLDLARLGAIIAAATEAEPP
jgi:CheY-like chemotaxis protein